jgi:hypothetical protein
MPAIGELEPSLAPINGKTNRNGQRVQFNLEDRVGREECFKLVQNLFLLRKEESPRVVIFAGVASRGSHSKRALHFFKELLPLRLWETNDQPREAT